MKNWLQIKKCDQSYVTSPTSSGQFTAFQSQHIYLVNSLITRRIQVICKKYCLPPDLKYAFTVSHSGHLYKLPNFVLNYYSMRRGNNTLLPLVHRPGHGFLCLAERNITWKKVRRCLLRTCAENGYVRRVVNKILSTGDRKHSRKAVAHITVDTEMYTYINLHYIILTHNCWSRISSYKYLTCCVVRITITKKPLKQDLYIGV